MSNYKKVGTQEKNEASHNSEDYEEPYRLRAATLRAWFMVYGIGSLAAILANDKLRQQIINSPKFVCIVGCFLVGVVIQVFLSLIYKHVMSYLYTRDEPNEAVVNFTHKMWPDLCVDLITLVSFGCGTWLLVQELAKTVSSIQ